MNSFEQRAAALGLSPTTSFAGILTIPTLDKLSEILKVPGSTPSYSDISAGAPDPGDDHTLAASDAIARHVYGTEPLSDADRALAGSAFPLQVFVVSQQDKTINSEWDLGAGSSGPVIVSLGTLIVQDGGYIVIANRTLDFTADTLVRQGNASPPNNAGLFNILGATGNPGQSGRMPSAPGQAQNGDPGNCSSVGIAGNPGGNGSPGTSGATGSPGGPGGPGLPSLPATIRLGHVQTTSNLPILTQSGAGGIGGDGGAGSTGGQGGNGGDGATCGCTGSAGGSGAQGGVGGTGGQGGQGGNGTDAAGNVTAYVPATAASYFVPIKLQAQPGAGGPGGIPGNGGGGGSAGSGGKHNSGGSSGETGGQGDTGAAGPAGTLIGQPADILIQPI